LLLEGKGFEREYAIRCLDANKHNHVTTCYYLLLKKHEKEGKIEASNYYQTAQTLYHRSHNNTKEINDEQNSQNQHRSKSSGRVQHRLLAESLEV
jgi:hypothetical protein